MTVPADEDLRQQVENLVEIGAALSGERDLSVLLEMIVDESRRLTRADAGTLYTVSDDGEALHWRIIQNDTMQTRIGGTSSVAVDPGVFKPVDLVVEGQRNLSNVSAFVAHTGRSVNIPDVYEAEGFDFAGPRLYDQATGYRSRSMLVVPLKDHECAIIGVLQLLNAKSLSSEVAAFSSAYERLITSLASQAAVAITNARLIEELEGLFDAFIQTIASAIDEKSPYTAGHVKRVTDLTMQVAQAVNASDEGLFQRIRLTDDELNELRIAAWMHDVGKITTPEQVVDKASKLETIVDRIEVLRLRYEILKRDARIAALEQSLASGEQSPEPPDGEDAGTINELDEELAFLERCNRGGNRWQRQTLSDCVRSPGGHTHRTETGRRF